MRGAGLTFFEIMALTNLPELPDIAGQCRTDSQLTPETRVIPKVRALTYLTQTLAFRFSRYGWRLESEDVRTRNFVKLRVKCAERLRWKRCDAMRSDRRRCFIKIEDDQPIRGERDASIPVDEFRLVILAAIAIYGDATLCQKSGKSIEPCLRIGELGLVAVIARSKK
jgi:hypothetical protein